MFCEIKIISSSQFTIELNKTGESGRSELVNKILLSFSEGSSNARLAQSVEHETLNLRVVGSSPTLGDIDIFKNIFKNRNFNSLKWSR